MCGFVGSLSDSVASRETLATACSAIQHRGPDAADHWTDSAAGIALGHRRLSILDLSEAGAQPMHSRSGRFVIAYNGEIYNHLELRESLEGPWRGHSDTETLLAAVDSWGIERALQATVGMFAFALWDRERRTLVLARDRFGEKPLYYGRAGRTFLFGSDLSAFRAWPEFNPEIDPDSLTLYMHYNAVPGAHCIYKGFKKLEPGCWIEISRDGGAGSPSRYWSARDLPSRREFGSELDAVEELDALLRRSVRGQMISDVPLGGLLSGGVDSSTVVALMQSQSKRPIRTFSIGFDDPSFDEAGYAKAVAAHLGTEHTELYATPQDALDVIPELPRIYSEPFADSSQIPTVLVSRLARTQVTVALSGDGGDEMFGGYSRYFLATSLWNKMRVMPRPARRALGSAIKAVPPGVWDRLFALMNPVTPRRLRMTHPGDKIEKGAGLLDVPDGEALYRRLCAHWPMDLPYPNPWPGLSSLEENMMLLDTLGYLPDDILTKVDRAAMSVSLETRVPLLDHRIFEFAWSLPLSMRIRNGQGKWILRQVLDRYVPRNLIERPKKGFGVPIGDWLRGPLRDWAEALLDESQLDHFDAVIVRRKWKEHLSGRRNWQYHLWDVLMFQAWNAVHT